MQCRIIYNKIIAENIYQMAFKSSEIAYSARPGQFVHIKVNDSAHILRRPFSISNVKDDIVYIIYQVKGRGTELLSEIQVNDIIDVLGPLGTGFGTTLARSNVIIIGGGLGVAPLLYLNNAIKVEKKAFLGFRDKSQIYMVDEFYNAEVSTESGNYGHKGYVTDLLLKHLYTSESRPDVIYSCGPVNMLKAVKKIAKTYNIPCQVSLEERMGCGIGACLVCSCKIKSVDGWHYKRVCKDGPVFMADEVIFDD